VCVVLNRKGPSVPDRVPPLCCMHLLIRARPSGQQRQRRTVLVGWLCQVPRPTPLVSARFRFITQRHPVIPCKAHNKYPRSTRGGSRDHGHCPGHGIIHQHRGRPPTRARTGLAYPYLGSGCRAVLPLPRGWTRNFLRWGVGFGAETPHLEMEGRKSRRMSS
jgi:hypothetical protein